MKKTVYISILLVAVFMISSLNAYAAGGTYYVVKPGDCLYNIGKKFDVDYNQIMKLNKLKSTVIYPGMKLNIPQGNSKAVALTNSNLKEYEVKPVLTSRHGLINKEDIRLLARLIYAEARGESLQGQIAVGAVILNRMASDKFPQSIKGVIYQRTKGGYQFTPVGNGQINLEPDRTAYQAAERALKGEDPTEGALFFYNPKTSSDQWIKTRPVKKVIGNHVFAK